MEKTLFKNQIKKQIRKEKENTRMNAAHLIGR